MIKHKGEKKTRNSKVLKDFVAYCNRYPDLRFWQALKNWSGYYFIFGSKNIHFDDFTNLEDTYAKETK